MQYYPIFLNIAGKRCVVIGGGEVALRKVRMLLDFGGEVVVIGPVLCPELGDMEREGRVKAIHREYREGDLEGAFVAIAATDRPEVNEMAAREAGRRRVHLNVVDAPELSTFIVPSYFRRGALTVAVSTGGASPALARAVRRELEKRIGEDYAVLAEIVEAVRSRLRAEGATVSADAWAEALDLERLLEVMRRAGPEAAMEALVKALLEGRSE